MKDKAQECIQKIGDVMIEFTQNNKDNPDLLVEVDRWILNKSVGCILASEASKSQQKKEELSSEELIKRAQKIITDVANDAVEDFFEVLEQSCILKEKKH